MSISSWRERSRLLKETKAEFNTEKVVISSDVRNKLNILKVERDIEGILDTYYDSGEYAEFEITYKKEAQNIVLKLLRKYGIDFIQLKEGKVLIKCL